MNEDDVHFLFNLFSCMCPDEYISCNIERTLLSSIRVIIIMAVQKCVFALFLFKTADVICQPLERTWDAVSKDALTFYLVRLTVNIIIISVQEQRGSRHQMLNKKKKNELRVIDVKMCVSHSSTYHTND